MRMDGLGQTLAFRAGNGTAEHYYIEVSGLELPKSLFAGQGAHYGVAATGQNSAARP